MIKSIYTIRFFLFIVLLSFIANNFPAPILCWANSSASEDTILSLETAGKTLREVLSQLGESAGYSIIIAKEWENTAVLPAQFNSVKMENALRVIVQSVGIKNYALLRDDKKKKLTIFVVSPSRSNESQGSTLERTKERIPEFLIAEHHHRNLSDEGAEPASSPPVEVAMKLRQDKPGSDYLEKIPPPPQQIILRHHDRTGSSNDGAIFSPPEDAVLRTRIGKSGLDERQTIPRPSKEFMMRR
jgi:hypothetical protein